MLRRLGQAFSWLTRRKPALKEVAIVIIGLDNAGKTTLMHAIRGEKDPYIAPTVGVSRPVQVPVAGYNVTIYDMGGAEGFRGVWKNFYSDVHGAVFVVDSADHARLEESRAELMKQVALPRLDGKPLLLFANKQDLPGAVSEVDVAMRFNLDSLARSRHSVVKCIARAEANSGNIDERIEQGLAWLANAIQEDFEQLDSRVRVEKEEAKMEHRQHLSDQRKRVEEAQLEREEAARREREGEAAEASPADSGAASDSSAITCSHCKAAPAVRKSGASGWKPVCDACDTSLKQGRAEEKEGEQPAAAAAAAAGASDAPTDGAADAAGEEGKAEDDERVIMCSQCGTERAVRKSGACGWKPVCGACGDRAEKERDEARAKAKAEAEAAAAAAAAEEEEEVKAE